MVEEDEDDINPNLAPLQDEPQWSEFTGRQKIFPFTGKKNLQVPVPADVTPLEVFSLLLDDNIWKMITDQTNIYAAQQKEIRSQPNAKMPLKTNSRLNKWVDTTVEEMKIFLGLILWMGLNRRGTIEKYWSDDPLFISAITQKGRTMSRNRFQILLNCFHFTNNELVDKNDRLNKIQPLIDALKNNYQKVYVPAEDFVIDETLVPWRGRLVFRQYIPNKTHKYGIKLFKLCSLKGYTYNSSVYSGQSKTGEKEVGLAQRVCEELSKDLLDEGRTLFVDNFYTSYNLAAKFLERKTHVVGTVRANRKKFPKNVMDKKLKRGEMIAMEDQNGIVILKWKDKRDVRMLSTKHSPNMVEAANRRSSRRPQ